MKSIIGMNESIQASIPSQAEEQGYKLITAFAAVAKWKRL
jgi:hypothetical protein